MPSTPGDQHGFGANQSPQRVPGKRYVAHRNGLATYDVRYEGVLAEGETIGFTQGDPPIDGEYPDLVLLDITVTGGENICGYVIIDLHYEGKVETAIANTDVNDDIILEYVANQEDIYAHPDFKKFAGIPGAVKHGAVFDPNNLGKFSFFNIVDPDLPSDSVNLYAGIQSYLLPTPVIHLSRIEDAWPNSEEFISLGKIVDDLSAFTNNAPVLPAGSDGQPRNWLYESLWIRNIANTYFETRRGFKGSGPRPINKGIYGNPPDFS